MCLQGRFPCRRLHGRVLQVQTSCFAGPCVTRGDSSGSETMDWQGEMPLPAIHHLKSLFGESYITKTNAQRQIESQVRHPTPDHLFCGLDHD